MSKVDRGSSWRRRIAVVLGFLVVLSLGSQGTADVRRPADAFPVSWLWTWLPQAPAWGAPPKVPTPQQQRGTAAGKGHYVKTADTRAAQTGGPRHKAGKGAGEVAQYAPHKRAAKQQKTGPARGDGSFNAKTSTRVAAAAAADSDLYRNADGSYTRHVYQDRVNYRAPDGSWQPIDTTIVTGSERQTGGRLREKADSWAADFGVSGADAALVSLRPDATHAVSYALRGAQPVTPIVKGATATYPGIVSGTDLELTTLAGRVKESLILHSSAAANSWVFPLRLQGLTPRLAADGSVELRNEAGHIVLTVPAPSMSDSAFDPHSGEPATSTKVAYALTTVDGAPALTLTADSAWLHDKARKYPVTVDPTFQEYPTGSTYAETTATGNHSGAAELKAGTSDGGSTKAYSFLQFNTFGTDYAGAHISAVSLHLFDFWAYSCAAAPFSVNPITGTWTPSSVTSYPGPSFGAAIGSLTADPHSACKNTGHDTSLGTWMSVPLQVDTFNSWARGGTNRGLAVTASQSDSKQWKQFDSRNAVNPPYLQVTYADNVPPQIDTAYPPDNETATTLTPELMATGHDPDAWPSNGSIQYSFTVYDKDGHQLATSGTVNNADWVVPPGVLKWAQSYFWTVQTYDGNAWSDPNASLYALSTPVPQPAITSSLSQNSDAHGYDPSIGDYTTSATDAQITTVGPALSVVRDYNSSDPRTTGGFGTGWSSLLDARATEQTGPNGAVSTVVITYPDGSEVAFGRNADGTFTPPGGRFATFTAVSGGGYTLLDKNGTGYTFARAFGSGAYGISTITDAQGHQETFGYTGNQPTTIASGASGRALHVTWNTPSGAAHPHVATVTTDPASPGNATSASVWTYTYTGDELTSVCPPTSSTHCTVYGYTSATAYPYVVRDTGPHSYWRLSEAAGATTAASTVQVNEGTDNGTYHAVTLGQPGSLAGSNATTAGFNGTSSYVQLPQSLVDSAQYHTVSLWFQTTHPGGVLFSYQVDPITNATTAGGYVPSLYIGSSGKLLGEFWYAGGTGPIVTGGTVTDGKWHHVVLAAGGNSQSMYLDGSFVGAKSGLVTGFGAKNEYVGAGFIGGGWPDEPHSGSSTGQPTYFNGNVSDVGFFDQYLTAPSAAALYNAGHTANRVLQTVTRPSGAVYAQVGYDPGDGSVRQVTDENGGTWHVGSPVVGGTSQVYKAAVLGDQPRIYYRFNEADGSDAISAVRDWGPSTYNSVTLGADGPFIDSTAAAFDGESSYVDIQTFRLEPDEAGRYSISLWFRTTTPNGPLFTQQYGGLYDDPNEVGPAGSELYVGNDGKLVAQVDTDGDGAPIVTPATVTDGKWHFVTLSAGSDQQVMYLDGSRVGTRAGKSWDVFGNAYVGAGFLGGWQWPDQANGDTPALAYFAGSISDVAYYGSALTDDQVTQQWTSYKAAGGFTPVSSISVTDPGNKPIRYDYDLLNGGRMVGKTDALGSTTSYGYDASGFLSSTTDANGDYVLTGHDVRGNTVSQTSCIWIGNTDCETTYYTYYPDDTSTTLTPDPRNDLVLTMRDGRSSSATDNTYLTSYTYDAKGNRTVVTTPPVDGFPNGRNTTVAYTDATTVAVDGGAVPVGLPAKVTSPGNRVQSMRYFHNGDLAQVTDPAGLVTKYTYDGLGRTTTSTVVSDTFPAGLTTAQTYDGVGEVLTQTDPPVTDRVTGATHTARTTTTYNPDGAVTAQKVEDLTGGDAPRTMSATYNAHGLLESNTDALGKTTTYGYNAYGAKTSQIDPTGAETDYAYDADGRLLTTSLVGYTGGDTEHPQAATTLVESSRAYDPGGRLASVTDSMGRVTEYTYYDNNQVARIARLSADGTQQINVSANAYDGAGNLIESVTNADYSRITDYDRDAAGRVTSVTDGNYGGKGGPTPHYPRVTLYTYSPDDNVVSSTLTDPDRTKSITTEYGYDALGRKTSETLHNGTEDRHTTWTLDQRGLPTAMTDPLGDVTGYSYDEAGRLTVTVSPAVDVERNAAAPVHLHPITTVGYDTFGSPVETQDPDGDVATVGYDAAGRQVANTLPRYTAPGSTTPITATSTRTYSDLGQLLTTTDPLGHSTSYTYDQLGDVATITAPDGGVTRNVYDSDGELLSTTDPTGAVSQATYDFVGREATSTRVVRQPAPAAYTTTYAYAWQGPLGSTTSPDGVTTSRTYNDFDEVTAQTDGSGNVTRYQYDMAGRRTVTTLPDGTSATVSYDNAGDPVSSSTADAQGTVLTTQSVGYDAGGRAASATDARGHTTTFTYDALGHVTAERQPVTDTTAINTSFGYDARGNRTRFTDGRGNAFLSTYNTWNLPEAQIEPATTAHPAAGDRTFTTAYDADGRPAELTAPGGVSITNTYDEVGNLTTQHGRGAEAATADRTFGYDRAGRITSFSAPGGTNAVTFDDRGLPLTVTGPSGDSSFRYTGDGTMARRTDAAGTTSYTYDAAGRLKTLTNPASGADLTYQYNQLNAVNQIAYGTGDTRTFGYDALHRLTSDTLAAPGGATVASIQYGYDANGNETSKATTGFAGSSANTYTYDYANRLASWDNGTTTVAYGYDDSGNRTRAGDRTFGYDQRNELTSGNGTTYSYTARGTLASTSTGAGTTTTKADAFNEIVNQGPQTYAYDAVGRLVSATGVTGLAYTGIANTLAADGGATYTRDPGSGVVAITAGSGPRLALTDQHNDLVGQFTANATALSGSTTFDPLGNVSATTGMVGSLGYESAWTDHSTGRVNLATRWYNPDTGQFDSRDATTLSATPTSVSANRFAYVNDNPLAGTDPTGQCSWYDVVCGAKKVATTVVHAATTVVNTVSSWASSAWNTVSDWASSAWNAVTDFVGDVFDKAADLYNSAKKNVTKVVNAAAHAVNTEVQKVKDAAEKAKQAAIRAANDLKQATANVVHTVTHYTQAAAHVVNTAYHATVKATEAAAHYVEHHAASIAAFVASTAVFIGCDAAMGVLLPGAGAVVGATACGALAGAVGGAVGYAVGAAQSGHFSWSGLGKAALVGGVSGAVGGLLGGLGGKAVSWLGGKAASALGGLLRSGAEDAAADVASDVGSTVADDAATSAASDAGDAAAGDAAGDAAAGDAGGATEEPAGAGEPEPSDSQGPSCKGHSFDPATPVLMADGTTKAIKDVRLGDKVASTNPVTGGKSAQSIVELHHNHDTDLTDVSIESADHSTAIVHTTSHHPLWDATRGAWVAAGSLLVGHRLRTDSGVTVVVTAVRSWTGQHEMLDLTLAAVHTYFVSAGVSYVLVHNCDGSTNEHLSDLPVHEDINKFNVRAGEMVNNRVETHPINEFQMQGGETAGHGGVANLSNEELITPGGPQGNDPIRGTRDWAPGDCGCFPGSRVIITGGHHRTAEIARRVLAGEMDPNTLIEFVISAP
jgi:large repetitive protein